MLSAYIESAGYNVATASDGGEGLHKALNEQFDMCVIDIMLPSKSGLEIASAMRQADRETPILFLTALSDENDILKGFEIGADDYITKPFSPRVLLFRIAAILKRSRSRDSQKDSTIGYGPIELNESQALCLVDGQSIDLTPHEFKILKQLMQRPNKIYERHTLIASIYGNEYAVSPKAIDVHMHNLRSKLGAHAGEMIQTVRGFGYKILVSSNQAGASNAVASVN